ncbi:MAG TPA: cbb3-type cytochrome c oxidase subunit I, partial [Verrucomicrobiae bacterium]|nr:cbb3-type cytochrome c oxidase subunit I [Verrucomicrobiae bacterium]
FGFGITLPMVNYYEHATCLTVTHGHTALFGTYGMLAIGLMLFAYRGIVQEKAWKSKAFLIKSTYWATNAGLALMFLASLLPVGILQFMASYSKGLWYARSPEFYNQQIVRWLGEIRIVPDSIIIALGAIPLLLFFLTTLGKLRPAEVKDNQEVDFTPGQNNIPM